MSQPVIKNLPLHEECSGLANLNARQRRELRQIDLGVTLAIGMVLGALIVSAIFLFTNLNQH